MESKNLNLVISEGTEENRIFLDKEWNMNPSIIFQNPDGPSVEITHDWKFLNDGYEIKDPTELGSLLMEIAEKNKKEGYALWN